MTSSLDYALYYISRGWNVFILQPHDKIPYKNEALGYAKDTPGGFYLATLNQEIIKDWLKRFPHANLAIATGEHSKLTVLDVDPKNGGNESLLDLVATYGKLPDTIECLTGGGGRHIYFEYPAGLTIQSGNSKLAPGLDIKANGGYVVAPPSIHPNGQAYAWEPSGKPSQTSLAPMPAWLVELVSTPVKETAGDEPHKLADPLPAQITSGNRNETMTSLAGTMRRRGMNYDSILPAMLVENQQKCSPPLSADEINAIVKSVCRYAPAEPPRPAGPRSDIADDEGPNVPLNSYELGVGFIELLSNLEGRSIPTFIPPLDRAIVGMERQTLTVLAARPGMGKTTLGWQIARNVAAHGMKVLFFSMEMSAVSLWAKAVCGSLGMRWLEIKRNPPPADELMVKLCDRTNDLMDRYANLLLVDDGMNSTDTIGESVKRQQPDLIVVDHLRLANDRQESEVRRLGFITKRLKDIGKAYNAAVLCLAQLNRATEGREDKRPQLADLRDSGEIEENADNVWMIYRPDYYQSEGKPLEPSMTELLIRKFRDDISNSLINLMFLTKYQWFADPRDPNGGY